MGLCGLQEMQWFSREFADRAGREVNGARLTKWRQRINPSRPTILGGPAVASPLSRSKPHTGRRKADTDLAEPHATD